VGLFYFFNNSYADSFIYYEVFYCCCSLIVCCLVICNYFLQPFYKYIFLCVCCPCSGGFAVFWNLRALYPFVYRVLCIGMSFPGAYVG
jgi:hypothetical protein